ncbi:hypothetical protein PHYBOEH_010701 [Phytophthora boehmeriae]|uniref:DNA-directed DNA polymerase n=1 Tax=Phytophthora boehmeriae TaxID=109152 RepID=A0A8T1WWZ4_9STRA|nr:hypothetical protein PHYBOEH_010701 [Phytophthora boehmeriae]
MSKTPEKRAASRTKGPAAKMVKRSSTPSNEQLLLNHKRVLLVPIGSDVSRQRLKIWQSQVEKLGGSVVHIAPTANNKTVGVVDWKAVDVVIASVELTQEKAAEFLQIPTFPPENKAVYAPEWLVYLLKEKKRPTEEVNLTWSGQKQVRQEEEKAVAKRVAELQALEEEESTCDENSVSMNKESARSTPAPTDIEDFHRQQDEFDINRAKLLRERTPIFYKNNPDFKPINETTPGSEGVRSEEFICQRSSANLRNLNEHLTDPLGEMMEFLAVEQDIWRHYAYKKVVSSLKAMRHRVSSAKDLQNVFWAKGRLRDKVIEILETGRLSKLDAKKSNKRLFALVAIARIWGVGPVTATKLYSKGYKSLDDLRKPEAAALLTTQQKIGLKHYQDFLAKIPRAEAQQIEKAVVDEVHKLIPNAQALACGSYRRGAHACGDVDVLITDPDAELCGILPDDLNTTIKQQAGSYDTYMGVCRISENLPYRRLDIKVCPRRYFGFATLYFTGSDHFNRSVRLFANKYGWSLSDRALTRVVRVNGRKIRLGDSVICESEVDVFIALGLNYKDPTERNCFDVKFVEQDALNAYRKTKIDQTLEEEDESE